METLLPPRPASRVHPWPYRPKLQPDELLSSYLMRLALGMDLKPITFLNTVWGSKRNLLGQDLDAFIPERVAVRIAAGTGIDVATIRSMALSEYVGTLLTTHNPKGRNPWLLPTTIENNRRHRHGLQFCPICLATGPVPYFRRRWRLAFVTSCTTHGVLLRDRCPTCGEPVHQHGAFSTRHCAACGSDLCVPTTVIARHDHLSWQARLEAGLTQGWIMLGDEPVRSHIVFAIVRQVAALLVNGRRADHLRRQAARAWGGDPAPYAKPTSRQPLEYLDVAERHRLFDMTERLMQGWPHRFVHACHEADFHRSHAIRNMVDPPFAYESVMRAYMDRTPYKAAEPEVAAAAAWLRRTRGIATYRDLKDICGESRDAIYTHMDYARRPRNISIRRVTAQADSNGRGPRQGREAEPTEPFWLSDAQWARVAPLLPVNGRRRVDDRRIVSGVIHALMNDGRWTAGGDVYAPRKTLHNRFVRWTRAGVWKRVFAQLSLDQVDGPMIDPALHDRGAGG